MSGVGDVNADRHDDFIVGASGDRLGLGGVGSATVFSGLDGSVIFRVYGHAYNDEPGEVVCGGGDVNGDGLAEVAVVAQGDDTNGSNTGVVRVLTLASAAVSTGWG